MIEKLVKKIGKLILFRMNLLIFQNPYEFFLTQNKIRK